ncbi:lysophospholipid acyltransferase family protein [Limosilactobacillus caecicola]|uniref:lysophospholipid acyltransferase family protein n=1 Tax=Limosilactobacillus caecicola TaxID=2941332 RepID=UPI00203C9558|nr:lysophospholipid acyltransferase family protein [Limosilactobacillus caecicola]
MRTYRYRNFDEDLVHSRHQDYLLPDDYQIIPTGRWQRVWNQLARLIVKMIGWVLICGYYRLRVVGQEKLRQLDGQSYFVYANHTQPVGDVFVPFAILPANRLYLVAGQANWGIPVLGKLLVRYGGLPVGTNLHQSIKLLKAIQQVINDQKIVMVYPEAHVWPYYTGLRPFPATSFNFPVNAGRSVFTLTTTYQTPRWGKRPRMVTYVDGPFYPDTTLPKKVAQEQLYQQVRHQMAMRTKLSDYQYYHYEQKEKDSES